MSVMRVLDEHEIPDALEEGAAPLEQTFIEERQELERVLRHPEISRSASLVRFLSYICSKYFEGNSKDIREYTIAVEALGRKETTFDSQIDPIVRVTARALRKKLREFYENGEENPPIQIDLPLGHYVPRFLRRPEQIVEPTPVDVSRIEALANPEPALPASGPKPSRLLVTRTPSQAGKRKTLWKHIAIASAVPVVFLVGLLLGRSTHDQPAIAESIHWDEPIWSDEFNGASNAMPDLSKWTFDLGNQNSWGNHELETYCAPGHSTPKGCDPMRPNAFQDGDGHLVLRAEKNADGNWTSARITTRGLRTFQYGRIEARMKLPVGTGLWPAFWMLGANFSTAGWPASGTVDVVENVALTSRSNGLGPTTIRSSLHAPGFFGGNSLRSDYRLPNGAKIDDGFHTYGILWSPGMMQFYFDDPSNVYFVRNISDMPDGGEWVFDHPFYLVMDLAVGGDWSGDPDNTTPDSAEILVDYVRAYKIPNLPAPTIQWRPSDVSVGSVARSTVNLTGSKGTGRVYLACSTVPATVYCSLDASTVNFTDRTSLEDTVTIAADALSGKDKATAEPGHYKLILTATTLSGAQSRFEAPFEIKSAK